VSLSQILAVKNHILCENPLRKLTLRKFLLTLVALLPVYALALFVAKQLGKQGLDPAHLLTGDMVMVCLGGTILYFVACKPFGTSVAAVARLRLTDREPFSSLLVFGVGGYLLSIATIVAVLVFLIVPLFFAFNFQLPESAGDLSKLITQVFQHGSMIQKAILLFDVCLLTPIIEEAICRGFLYQWLRTRMKILPALILSAAFFALLHFDPGSMIVFIPVGLATAIAFELSGSLFSAILTHSLWNATAVALTVASINQPGT
jgi:membrane protease YdiL (CAAX protease family)